MNYKLGHLISVSLKSLIVAVMFLGLDVTVYARGLPGSNIEIITESNKTISVPWSVPSTSTKKYFMPEQCTSYIASSSDGSNRLGESLSIKPEGELSSNGWLFLRSKGYGRFTSEVDLSNVLRWAPGAIAKTYFFYKCSDGRTAFSESKEIMVSRGMEVDGLVITAPENFISSNAKEVMVNWESGSEVSDNCSINITDYYNNKIGSIKGKLNGEAKVAVKNITSNGIVVGVQCALNGGSVKQLASSSKSIIVTNLVSNTKNSVNVSKFFEKTSTTDTGKPVSQGSTDSLSQQDDSNSLLAEKALLRAGSKSESSSQGSTVSQQNDSKINLPQSEPNKNLSKSEPNKNQSVEKTVDSNIQSNNHNLPVSASVGAKMTESGATIYWSSSNALSCRVWDSFSQRTRYNLPPSGTFSISNGFCGRGDNLNYAVRCFSKEDVQSMNSDGTSLGASDRGFLTAQSCATSIVSSSKSSIKELKASQSLDGKSLNISWDTDRLKSCRLFLECPNISSETRYGSGTGSESFNVSNLEDGKSCSYRIRCFESLTDASDLSNYGGVDQSGGITVKKTSGITEVNTDNYQAVNFTADAKFDGKKMNLSWNASPLAICRLS